MINGPKLEWNIGKRLENQALNSSYLEPESEIYESNRLLLEVIPYDTGGDYDIRGRASYLNLDQVLLVNLEDNDVEASSPNPPYFTKPPPPFTANFNMATTPQSQAPPPLSLSGIVVPPSSASNEMYTLLVDPPLPGFIAWVPVVCRWMAVFIAVPFLVIILLDIVAYLIARTLHLRPLNMRVPRSPASTLKELGGKASPGGASELLLPNVSEGELSPVVVKKVLHSVGLQEQPRDGQREGKVDMGREDEEGKGGLDMPSGLGLDVRGTNEGDEGEREGSVRVRPPTPTVAEVEVGNGLEYGQQFIRGDEVQTDFVRPGQALTEEPEATINLGAPIASANPRDVVSPTPTLGDELETDACYGIDAMADDLVGKRDDENTGDLADDALAGWTGSKAPVAHATVDETVHTNEGPQEDKQKKPGFEPIKGKEGEPSVHLGEWEPVDFKAQFEDVGKDEVKGTDDALKALGDKLAQEEAAGVKVQDAQKEEEAVKLDLTIDELKDLLRRAQEQKAEGNTLFQHAEPDLDGAIGAYKEALNLLPITSFTPQAEPTPPPSRQMPESEQSGVMELTDEQAEAIRLADEAREAELRRREEEEKDPEVKLKRGVEREIKETKKAVWGNLGAVWVKKGDDKEAVTACTEALKLDPHYVKVLQRRALASERIGSWSSLTTAQEDYTALTQILPKSSPLYQQAQRSLTTLPTRIRTQQEKEKDEMLSKLKDLGDGLLGRFGLSTNNFKFDKQEGGGYSMRFER